MRNIVGPMSIAVVLTISAVAQVKPVPVPLPEAHKQLPQDSSFIVHEWGTFTSFSGSDGVSLDFRPLVEEDLPLFVMDRQKQAFFNERRDIAYRTGVGPKGAIISKQRMETPVTYFYTDSERIVDVTVEFPRGLLTEFYPPVRQFGPAFKKDAPEPMEHSFLRWGKVRLIPPAQAIGKMDVDPFIVPVKKGDGDHYAYARETDSAHLQLSDAATGIYREKFLFYRGVGNFDLPVSLRSSGQDRFILSNTSTRPLRFAFIIQVDGQQVRYARYDNLTGQTDLTLPGERSTAKSLADDMVKALVGDGMYEKEARAMVKTWQTSWFTEPGTRVLYSLPQAHTDALLPLHLAPAPRELTRVMIGRLETLTPEQEGKIEALVARLGAAHPQTREQTASEIRKLGRFAEPALNRICKLTDDPEVQANAKKLLKELLDAQQHTSGKTPSAN